MSTPLRMALFLSLPAACALPPGDIGEVGGLTSTTGSGSTNASTSSAPGSSGSESDGSGGVGACGTPAGPCAHDIDGDGIDAGADNQPNVFNPDQRDIDGDGIADVIDLCPTVAGTTNTADSDKDGLGNACDNCENTLSTYNANAEALGIPEYMWVRNLGDQSDADGDGIGDVCDNCVATPNCGADCQTDADGDLIGDACLGVIGPQAAGPVGFGETDDFDQDGLTNLVDICPRQPLPEVIACNDDDDCPGARCSDQVCNHADIDGDGKGDICDTCPASANALQVGAGAVQEDDPDGDGVGAICEIGAACQERWNPPPFDFRAVAVNGLCCTVALVETVDGYARVGGGSMLTDPDSCIVSSLPPTVIATPGVVFAPVGCDQALADAGFDAVTNPRLGPDDFGGDLDELWSHACRLPQLDQDFDGLGEVCDLCPQSYDPSNEAYVDDLGTLWPNAGRVCNGVYSPMTCEP